MERKTLQHNNTPYIQPTTVISIPNKRPETITGCYKAGQGHKVHKTDELHLVREAKEDWKPRRTGSFDLLVRMDWMAEHRAEVVCYEKYIRVPYGNDMLIIQGERSGVKNESRLEVISSIRTQIVIEPKDVKRSRLKC
ncbi:hypothetical protein Tco_1044069 [Tanacetum coccineum]|uniref:Reverse transcriptase domain-containing protein n=1 Tax=Tanacetum coccineum TaxID=301880 RepID=A0ABQ5GQ45_9ASTR